MKKNLTTLFIGIFSLFLLVGCGDSKSGGDKKIKQKYKLRLGTVLNENDPTFLALKEFKKSVEEKTDGNIDIELYSGSQLGADEDVLEQAKVGAGVGVVTDPGRMSNYIKEMGILGGPYLADDYEGALKVMNTSVYKDLVKKSEDYGFKILSFNYFQGSRNLYTKSKVENPSDLKGLRVRSSGSEIVTKTVEAMGANSTVLPWSEAYQALQQKVIEGVEVHNSAAVGSSIYEVTSYVSITGHFQLLTGLVISNEWFKKLPEEYQNILVEESYKAGKIGSQAILANDSEYLKKVVDSGIEVIQVDKDAFREATKSVYDNLGYGDLKRQIEKEINSN